MASQKKSEKEFIAIWGSPYESYKNFQLIKELSRKRNRTIKLKADMDESIVNKREVRFHYRVY